MRYVRWKALNCGVWPPTSEFVLSLPLMRSLPKVSATATAALRIKAAWTVPTLKPASGSSCGASSRSIFGRWQQCFCCLCGSLICAAKLGCVLPTLEALQLFRGSTRRRLLGARDASVASLDLSVVLGRRTFNRVVEGAGRGPSCGPSPSRRVLRIWGHWAHLMTTVHRGRSSDGGFVAQFLRLRKSVRTSEPGRFRHCFLALFTFLGTVRLACHSYASERRLGCSLAVQALQTKSTS